MGGSVAWVAEPVAMTLIPMGLIFALILFTTVGVGLSNVMNNTATAAVIIPILIATSVAMAATVGLAETVTIKLFILPVALGLSVAFITPIATPSSILVYDTGLVSKKEMARAGLQLTIPAILIVVWAVYFLLWAGVV